MPGIHRARGDPGRQVQLTRTEENGGDKDYLAYEEVEADFLSEALHPGDVKPALARHLNQILQPVRDHFQNNPEAKASGHHQEVQGDQDAIALGRKIHVRFRRSSLITPRVYLVISSTPDAVETGREREEAG